MIRKLILSLISGAICLLGTAPLLAETNWGWSTPQAYEEATGNKIEKFNEAPMLKALVDTGKLPSIEERLPEEPLVDKPLKEVGKYGGVLNLHQESEFLWYPASYHTYVEYILNFDRKFEEIVPNIAKGWEFSEDGKTLTLFFRKGMKWSDGAPFTVDDILFFWESVILNDEVTPVKPAQWELDGELAIVEKLDAYRVRFHFSKPYWSIIHWLCGAWDQGDQNDIYLPQHVLEKYHINYNPEANELAKEEGYDYWWELFNAKRASGSPKHPNPEIPTLGPWIVKQMTTEGTVYERNPYYYKIDTAGNQMPYMDTVKARISGDLLIDILSGEYDYHDRNLVLKDYPVFVEGAEQGGYNIWLAPSLWGSDAAYYICQNYNEDPAIGEILRDVRFRQALSLAINREEINEILSLGKGVPRAAAAHPSCSFYKEEWARAYADYNPETANKLLDEMGLDKQDKDGFRLRPDGETLFIVIMDLGWFDYSELIKEYWEDVGVKASVKAVEASYLFTCFNAGTYMVAPWVFDVCTEFALAGAMNIHIKLILGAPLWFSWWNTKGEKGEEPPDELKRMWSLYAEVPYLSPEERNKALEEIFDIWAEGLWMIGTVGMTGKPAIANINLGNVNTDIYTPVADMGSGTYNRLYQLFWKK